MGNLCLNSGYGLISGGTKRHAISHIIIYFYSYKHNLYMNAFLCMQYFNITNEKNNGHNTSKSNLNLHPSHSYKHYINDPQRCLFNKKNAIKNKF